MLSSFERYILSRAVPSLNLPALSESCDASLIERAWILGYGPRGSVARGEENLRKLAMVVGILPASTEEIHELEIAGW